MSAALPSVLGADMSEQEQVDVAVALSLQVAHARAAEALQRAHQASVESEEARAARCARRTSLAAEEYLMTQRALFASVKPAAGGRSGGHERGPPSMHEQAAAARVPASSASRAPTQVAKRGCEDDEVAVDEAATAACAARKRPRRLAETVAVEGRPPAPGSPRARAVGAAEARRDQRAFESLESQRKMRIPMRGMRRVG